MFKLRILAICILAVVLIFSGIAFAQDKSDKSKRPVIGFGSGSRAIDGFGGSMSSRGSMNTGHGFGSGFGSGTGSGPMSSGNASSTGSTGTTGGGWGR